MKETTMKTFATLLAFMILAGCGFPQRPQPPEVVQFVNPDVWPGPIPYEIDSELPWWQTLLIEESLIEWSDSGVEFVPRDGERDYVRFSPTDEVCSSPVGYRPWMGAHVVLLSKYCHRRQIRHEIGHILGLHHEHQRADRDQHISVDLTKVPDNYHHNFDKIKSYLPSVRYDRDSVMHYSSYAFSKDGSRVMFWKSDGSEIEASEDISVLDLIKVRDLYKPERESQLVRQEIYTGTDEFAAGEDAGASARTGEIPGAESPEL
jgi:hypothetical protein